MSSSEALSLILGPLGALALALLGLAAIVYFRWLVPGYLYAAVEERARVLDEENAQLNESVMRLGQELAAANERLKHMEREIASLRAEVAALKGMRQP